MLSELIIGILAIIFGILILILPRLLKYLVGFYFIILGVWKLIGVFII